MGNLLGLAPDQLAVPKVEESDEESVYSLGDYSK